MISYISIVYVAGYTVINVYKYWDIINAVRVSYEVANSIYKGVKYLTPNKKECESVDDWELCDYTYPPVSYDEIADLK